MSEMAPIAAAAGISNLVANSVFATFDDMADASQLTSAGQILLRHTQRRIIWAPRI